MRRTVVIDDELLEEARVGLVESPFEEKRELFEKFKLDGYTSGVIAGREGGKELLVATVDAGADVNQIANWLTGEFYAFLNENEYEISDTKLDGNNFAGFLSLVDGGVISGPTAKILIREISETGQDVHKIVEEKGLKIVTGDDVLLPLVKIAIETNPGAVESYKKGKKKAAKAIVGAVMKATAGKADPQRVGKLVEALLEKSE